MASSLFDYIQAVSSIPPEILAIELKKITDALSLTSPIFQDTKNSEHYFDGYRCSDEDIARYTLKKSILDKLFNRNTKIAPLNERAMQKCLGIEHVKEMAKEQRKFFLMQHALLFSITKIGNCSERGAYAALSLFNLLKESGIKVGLQSLKTKDQFVVCLGNDERGWMVYDPFTNPHIVFEFSYYGAEMTPYFETHSHSKQPFKMMVTQGVYDQFLAQHDTAQAYVAEKLRSETPERLTYDVHFSYHLETLGVTIPSLREAHEQLCMLVDTPTVSSISNDMP
ncbi:MAG: hypothetical protein K0U37_08680 [Gammaproteobacteria bacterium]|nr:hypothetical protein [Gammaproteobacteria bacterium]